MLSKLLNFYTIFNVGPIGTWLLIKKQVIVCFNDSFMPTSSGIIIMVAWCFYKIFNNFSFIQLCTKGQLLYVGIFFIFTISSFLNSGFAALVLYFKLKILMAFSWIFSNFFDWLTSVLVGTKHSFPSPHKRLIPPLNNNFHAITQ